MGAFSTSAIKALLGVSTYAQDRSLDSLGDRNVERLREQMHGQISPLPTSRPRWTMAELYQAERQADNGDLSGAASLMQAARKDGHYKGILDTLTSGVTRLPKRFRGAPEIVAELEEGHDSVRGVFDEMCPASELALLAADGLELGVGVAELCPVQGRSYPVLRRLNPVFLRYIWAENRWYYQSIIGWLPITPGDGRWVLHVAGGYQNPWLEGSWKAVGRTFIDKSWARELKFNWNSKLANPARVAEAPQGATEGQGGQWFNQVAAWGINSVFQARPGYTIKILETNGRGWESFDSTVVDCNREYAVIVAGQVVTVDGGAGFSNSDIHKSIRADRIQATADSLSHTLNTQVLPQYVISRHGEDAVYTCPTISWDVTPPKDRNVEAQSMLTVANAIKLMGEALAPLGRALDIDAIAVQYGIPIAGDLNGDGRPDEATGAIPAPAPDSVEGEASNG